jgi:hypothetical protein
MAKGERNVVSQFFTGGVSVVKKLKLGTAVDSDIAIIIILGPGILVAFVITRFWPILFLLLFPLYMYYRHYEYLIKNKPEYLRSEKHEENMLRIQVGAMGEKNAELSEDAYDILPAESVTIKNIDTGESKKMGGKKR